MNKMLRCCAGNILGFAELIGDPRVGTLNPKQNEYLEDLLTSARHLLETIEDLETIGIELEEKRTLH